MAGRQRGAARARRAETRGCGCARLPHRPSAARVAAGEAKEAGGGGEDPRGGRRAHDHFFREVKSHLSHPSPCPGQRRAPDRPLAAAAPLPRRVRQGRRALRDERCEQRLFTPAAVNRWSSSARRARRRRAAGPRCGALMVGTYHRHMLLLLTGGRLVHAATHVRPDDRHGGVNSVSSHLLL